MPAVSKTDDSKSRKGTSLSDPACLKCRNRKLKCGKQKPICARCEKHSLKCEYAAPPDRRKLQAERRAQAVARNVFSPQTKDFASAGTSQQVGFIDSHGFNTSAAVNLPPNWIPPSTTVQGSPLNTWQNMHHPAGKIDLLNLIQPQLLAAYMPPPDLTVLLVHVYFDHVSGARMMFNQQALLNRYLQGGVPSCLILAIAAMASIFKEELRAQGFNWADLASQLALVRADRTSFTMIRTCEILALYWFTVGDKGRAGTHLGLAKSASRTISTLPTVVVSYQKSESPVGSLTNPDPPENNDNYVQGTADAGFADPTHTSKALGAWREVKILLTNAISTGVPVISSDVPSLDATFYEAHSALPPNLRVSTLAEFQCAGRPELRAFFFTLVCLCSRMVLYASQTAVFFHPAPIDSDGPIYQQSILQAVQEAGALITAYVQSSPDYSSAPITLGFSAFVTGSVYCHTNRYYDFESINASWQRVNMCLQLLTDMTPIYPGLAFFHQNLQSRLVASQNELLKIQHNPFASGIRTQSEQNELGAGNLPFTSLPEQEPFVPPLIGFAP